jgi:uncharacterized protein with FMN-binding domain
VRRVVAAVVLTVIALYFVLAYKSSPLSRSASALGRTAPTTSTAPAGSGGDGGQAPAGPPPPDTATTSPVTAAPPGSGAGPPSTTTPAGGRSGTFVGSDEQNQYGDVQVQITLVKGRITDVTALQLPFDRARSQLISQEAAPILRTEVLDAQSANIDTLSGATYTSEGYAASLQHALDQAGG